MFFKHAQGCYYGVTMVLLWCYYLTLSDTFWSMWQRLLPPEQLVPLKVYFKLLP